MRHDRRALLVLVAAHAVWLSSGPWIPDLARRIWLEDAGGAPLLLAFRLVIAPVVALGLAVSWLAPGLLAVGLRRTPGSHAERLLLAAPAAAWIHVAIASAAKTFGTPAGPSSVKALQLAVELALWIAGSRIVRPPALPERADRHLAVAAALLCAVATALLCEEVFVRELTSDGLESLDMGASLASHHLPRNPSASGVVGLGVGMIAQAFPAYWFTTAIGATEAAPRLPLVLFLPVLLAGVAALSERGLARRMSPMALSASGAALLSGACMLGLNVGLDPYYADLASPAALEAMAVAMMLGVVWAVFSGSTGWLIACALLAHFCRPSGLLLLLLLLAATFVVDRGARAKRPLRIFAAVAVCLAATFLYEKAWAPRAVGSGAVGLEAGSLLGRLRYLTFTDWQRVAIVAFASGLFPWLPFFRPRLLDRDARVAALACAGILGLFLLPAWYSPHHFSAAFVLPQVPYFRAALAASDGARRRAEAVALVLALVALVSVVPHGAPPQPFRDLAQSVSIDAPVAGPYARDLLPVAAPLERLVKLPWSGADPRRELVGSPLVLAWYARQSGAKADAEFRVVAVRDGVTLVGRSGASSASEGHPTDFARPLFRVPPDRLFRDRMIAARLYDLDLKTALGR